MADKSNERKASIRERIADAVDISKDVILNTVLMRVTGAREIILENYKGILEYSDTKIRVKATPKCVDICGSRLEIRTITDELLYISGNISAIAFVSEAV